MTRLLLAATSALALTASAHAANIAAFSQTSQSNDVVATANGTTTTITISDAAISVGQFIGGVAPPSVFSLSATSIDAAQQVGNAVIQHFNGSFHVTSGATNVLSGSFSDAAFGALGGPGLAVNVNAPPDALTLTSDLVPASELAQPSAFTLAFTNLSPHLAIVGTTIAPFGASFAGTVSASAVPAPEPLSLAIMGVGMLGLAAVKRRV